MSAFKQRKKAFVYIDGMFLHGYGMNGSSICVYIQGTYFYQKFMPVIVAPVIVALNFEIFCVL